MIGPSPDWPFHGHRYGKAEHVDTEWLVTLLPGETPVHLLNTIEAAGGKVRHASFGRGNLEQLFMALTRRSLRDWIMLLALMKKELLALSRDRHGLAALFLMPVLFIVIMSLALKDVYSPPVESIAYVVEDRDGTELSQNLLAQWEIASRQTAGVQRKLA